MLRRPVHAGDHHRTPRDIAAIVLEFEGDTTFLDGEGERAGLIMLAALLVSFLLIHEYLLQQRGDPTAEDAFRRAEQRGAPEGALGLGQILQRRGEPDASRAAYQRAATANDSEVADRAGGALRALTGGSDDA